MSDGSTLLEVANLQKRFGGVHAVQGVNFSLGAGEILALIGPNGAGKSTCFNMLNGQLRPDGGTIHFRGEDVTGLPPRAMCRRGAGRTFQITSVFSSMSVRENIQTAISAHRREDWRLFGNGGARHRAEASDLLEQTGLAAQADRACGELAYGDLKRLELGIALAGAPSLLLMDEPAAGMAPKERIAMMRFTVGMARDKGISVLFTEHDMDIVFEHATRVLVLNRGEIVVQGDPASVRRDPLVRSIYLGEGLTYAKPTGGAAA